MSKGVLVLSVTAKDCQRDTFRCGGPGGQNVNKVESGVRWTHRASGAIGKSCDQRTQHQNAKIAWRRMAETREFQLWLRKTLGQDAVEEVARGRISEGARRQVEKDMAPENLKFEYLAHGGWRDFD